MAERIAIESRILRAADVFDALVSARPYRREVAPAEAITQMKSLAGKVDASALAALEGVLTHGARELLPPAQNAGGTCLQRGRPHAS